MFLHGTGKIHWRNTKDQLQLVGPKSLGVALLTAGFVGMVFTIQVRKGHKKPRQACSNIEDILNLRTLL